MIGAAAQIRKAELVLGLCMPMLGRAPQPDDTVAEGGDDPFAAQIKQAQPIRALGLAGRGRPPEEPERLRAIARRDGSQSAAHGPAPCAEKACTDLRVHASTR
jgi:hypothetical protein